MSKDLVSILSNFHGKEFSVLTGNATTAIYVALSIFGWKRKKIAIPNNVCANVPLAVFFSGNEPVYLDIDECSYGLNVEELERQKDIVAVIAVHSYGIACRISKIAHLCKTKGWLLIEDCSVAGGATVDGKPVGVFGDIAINSFGSGKIIDVGHGGAIMFNDNNIMNECENIISSLPKETPANKRVVNALSVYHTSLYNRYYASGKNFLARFQEVAIPLLFCFLTSFDESHKDNIKSKFNCLSDKLKMRRDNVAILAEAFRDTFVCSEPDEASAPWRFNIILPCGSRDAVLHFLLDRKERVSSWYPSVDLFFSCRSHSDVITPVSDRVGDEILNLWVNEEVDMAYIERVRYSILSHLNGWQK